MNNLNSPIGHTLKCLSSPTAVTTPTHSLLLARFLRPPPHYRLYFPLLYTHTPHPLLYSTPLLPQITQITPTFTCFTLQFYTLLHPITPHYTPLHLITPHYTPLHPTTPYTLHPHYIHPPSPHPLSLPFPFFLDRKSVV